MRGGRGGGEGEGESKLERGERKVELVAEEVNRVLHMLNIYTYSRGGGGEGERGRGGEYTYSLTCEITLGFICSFHLPLLPLSPLLLPPSFHHCYNYISQRFWYSTNPSHTTCTATQRGQERSNTGKTSQPLTDRIFANSKYPNQTT